MEDIYEEINSDREKELQMSFEVLIKFFNDRPDEGFTYDKIWRNIDMEGHSNFSGNLALLVTAGYVRDAFETDRILQPDNRFSLRRIIPSKLNRLQTVRMMQKENDITRLLRNLDDSEEDHDKILYS